MPRIRALVVHASVSAIETLAQPRSKAVENMFPRGFLARVKAVGSLDWLDLSDLLECTKVAQAALTVPEHEKLWKEMGVRVFQSSLLSGVLSLALKVARNSPLTVLRSIPVAISVVGERMGAMVVEAEGKDGARMIWNGLCYASEPTFVGAAGLSFAGLAELVKVSASVSVKTVDPTTVVFELMWKPK